MHVYSKALKGFAISGITDTEAEAIAKDPNVAYVEENGRGSIATTQSNPPWGLDRIDQRNLSLDNAYHYYPNGYGVQVYVLDTGIRRTHNDFTNRVATGTFVVGNSTDDDNGHGTYMAGIAAGSTYGVAKSATIVPVKILDSSGQGTTADAIDGIDWVTDQASLPAVAVIGATYSTSSSLDSAVSDSMAIGVSYVVPAGNNSASACSYSPGRLYGALTVAASTNTDYKVGSSNYGTCVDLFAPGYNIPSDWNTSDSATSTQSGTSASAAHVAGIVALYLDNNPGTYPSAVASAIVNNATTNRLNGNLGTGSPNKLAYSPIDNTSFVNQNGSFEVQKPGQVGARYWTLSDDDIIVVGIPADAHAGFDFAEPTLQSGTTFYQDVTIPSNAQSAYLEFYLWIGSQGNTTLTAQIRSTGGSVLQTLGTFTSANSNAWYQLFRYNMYSYRGQTIRVYFETSSSSTPTPYDLDDVNLEVIAP